MAGIGSGDRDAVRFAPVGGNGGGGPTTGLKGSLTVPPDKSISHRAAIIAAICDAPVRIHNFLAAADTLATLRALEACGVAVERGDVGGSGGGRDAGEPGDEGDARGGSSSGGAGLTVRGAGLKGLKPPDGVIDVGNSGTTMRLLPGVFAGQEGEFTLDGDESIRRRPMDRIVAPLKEMGVEIEARDGRYAPVKVSGGSVRGIDYRMPVASAQVKSTLLLAGLYADGPVTVREPAACRDHTEIMLARAGARVERKGLNVTVHPAGRLTLDEVEVPGDFSSAAFFIVAAAIVAGSELKIEGVGVNPTRTGLLDILKDMGADISLERQCSAGGEPVADLLVRWAPLKGVEVGGEISGRAIDELPLVALAGAFAEGETVVSGAAELKVKESDRIAGLVENLAGVGVDIEVRGGVGEGVERTVMGAASTASATTAWRCWGRWRGWPRAKASRSTVSTAFPSPSRTSSIK